MKAKYVDFVFEYEVKPRELNNLCLVAAYLKNKGYSVAFVNSWESLYHKPRAYCATVAIISACYNDGTYDFFTGLIASYKKVVNMQWEQVAANGYYQKRDDKAYVYQGAGVHTRHVCWGEKEKNWLMASFGVEEDCLKVVGYLPLDFYRDELRPLMPSREQIFKQYGLDPSKKTLLFVSSFVAIDLPETEGHGNETMFTVNAQISYKSQKILLSWFEQLVQEDPDVQIIYRYHPAERNSRTVQNLVASNKNIYAIAELPISNWIMACDKIYNWCSTSMVEMMISGKDTYLCRPVSVPQIIDYSYFQNAHTITSYEEFVQTVRETQMASFPVEPQQVMQWYDIQAAPAYQRLGDWLIETYYEKKYISRVSNNNVHLFAAKKKAKRIIKRAIVYTKMAELCIAHLDENALTKRLKRIQADILVEDAHRQAVREKDGYIQSKYRLNSAAEEEINKTIEQYQKLIAQK